MAENRMKMMNTQQNLIFIPIPGIGHLASALELAKLIINRINNNNNNISITVLCTKLPFTTFEDSYTKSVSSSQPQIKLIDLPELENPLPQELLLKSPEHYIFTFIERHKPNVKSIIQNMILSPSSSSSSSNQVVLGMVMDFFCMPMIDVAKELEIPPYLFMTSGAGFLSFMLSLTNRGIEDVFEEFGPDLFIGGFSNLVPLRVLPGASFKKDGGYAAFYNFAKRFRETRGIIVNTFSELEHYAIDSLSLCEGDDDENKTPPIYAVGPLIDLKGQHNPNLAQTQHDKIMKFLDEQPNSSVILLCFGSGGSFGPSQTREIALALRNSGVRFLWSMRYPRGESNEGGEKLPEGFLEWMEVEGKGMICEWAPQVEVLAHKAIGGFVSHCGWNSILESLWFGVPILTWPIYAEQQLNAFSMVKEYGLSVELKLDYRRGSDVVMADEIEKGLKQLMNRDNAVHKKVHQMKEMARNAVVDGGSSFISVRKLIEDMIIGSK